MRTILPLALLAACVVGPLTAADPPSATYRLDFTVRENDPAQPVRELHYLTISPGSNWGRIQAGQKVPYLVEAGKYNYTDIGVTIDYKLETSGDGLALSGKFEVASVMSGGDLPKVQRVGGSLSGGMRAGSVLRVASFDEPVSGRHYEVEVLATKL